MSHREQRDLRAIDFTLSTYRTDHNIPGYRTREAQEAHPRPMLIVIPEELTSATDTVHSACRRARANRLRRLFFLL